MLSKIFATAAIGVTTASAVRFCLFGFIGCSKKSKITSSDGGGGGHFISWAEPQVKKIFKRRGVGFKLIAKNQKCKTYKQGRYHRGYGQMSLRECARKVAKKSKFALGFNWSLRRHSYMIPPQLKRKDAECKSGDTWMGHFNSMTACADAVKKNGGKYFIYGKNGVDGNKSKRCYQEHTNGCNKEGFETDSYDFYHVARRVTIEHGDCVMVRKSYGKGTCPSNSNWDYYHVTAKWGNWNMKKKEPKAMKKKNELAALANRAKKSTSASKVIIGKLDKFSKELAKLKPRCNKYFGSKDASGKWHRQCWRDKIAEEVKEIKKNYLSKFSA